MLTTPTPSPEETRANKAFDALLWVLSRPGQIRHLPAPGEAAIIDALLDRECRVYCADPTLMPQILKTGALIADSPDADHAFLGALADLDALRSLRVGSDLYPDDGATVAIRAKLGSGLPLRLTGPGVEKSLEVMIGGLPDGFWHLRRELIRYPMGFDLFLVDGDQVLGLPRSTEIEVL